MRIIVDVGGFKWMVQTTTLWTDDVHRHQRSSTPSAITKVRGQPVAVIGLLSNELGI